MFVEYRGREIACFYLNEDCESDFILVFLHDALGSAAQLKSFPLNLCKKLNCKALIIERLGHGNSGSFFNARQKNYMHIEAHEVLPHVFNTLQIQEKVILIGNSDGGSIALLYAAKFPEKVIALTAIAPHIFVENITIEGIKNTLKSFKSNPKLMKALEKYHGQKAQALFDAWHKTWLAENFHDWNIESYIADIQCKILLIQGDKDEYGSLYQIERIAELAKQQCTKLVVEAGHFPHLEKEEECIADIADFYRTIF